MTFSHWSLSDSISPQITRTVLSILADISNTVIWMISIRPLISKFFGPCTNPLVTVPRPPIIIGIIFTYMLHSYFSSLARFRYLTLFSFSFNFTQRSAGDSRVHNLTSSLFLVDYFKAWSSGRDYVIYLDLKILKKFVHLIVQDVTLGYAYTICS